MKPVRLFEEFINESLQQEAALRKVLALPNGSLTDDAKQIDPIFKINNRPWSQLKTIWKENRHLAKPLTLNPKDIQITQHEIRSVKVQEMIYRDQPVKTIRVIQFPEGPVIWDGHHRLTKAWALGETQLKVLHLRAPSGSGEPSTPGPTPKKQ